MYEQNKIKRQVKTDTDWSMELAMLIKKLFFLPTPKNKVWYKKDYSKDVIVFLSLTWISFMIMFLLGASSSNWYIVLGVAILFIICLVASLISYSTWIESRHLQLMHEMGDIS